MAEETKQEFEGRFTQEMTEMPEGMRPLGIMNDQTHKLTIRGLGKSKPTGPMPLTGAEIRALRERSHMSQAVFARRLSLSTGYISALERGAKSATGPTLLLLDVIRRKGLEAIL
jgi:putative transcriptional regulator